MRRAAVAMAACVWVAAGAAYAAPTQQPKAAAPQQKARKDPGALREARGKVAQVDANGKALTLTQPDDKLTLKVDRTTTIFIDGRIGTLDEIAEGQEIRASYENRQGGNHAQWVEVSKKPLQPEQTKETLPEAPGK